MFAGMPVARGVGAGGIHAVFLTTVSDAVNRTTYTFSAVPFGDASAKRRLIVAVHGNFSTGRSLDSVTIGGVPASIDFNPLPDYGVGLAWCSAVVPSGTSGDVVVTFNASQLRCLVAVYALYGSKATGPFHANYSTANAGSFSLNVPGGGAVFASQTSADGVSGSVSGITEYYRGSLEITTWQVRGGMDDMLAAQTRAMALPSVSSGLKNASGVSWGVSDTPSQGIIMTAEQQPGNPNAEGYASPLLPNPYGSISGEPLPGFVLRAFGTSSAGTSYPSFFGNAVSAMAGKSIYINGTPYTMTGFQYYSAQDYSQNTGWAGAVPPRFTPGVDYLIEIK